MKKLISLLALLAGATGVFAQGVVNFNNNNLPAIARVYLVSGPPVLGSEFTDPPSFVAQLYWSTDGGNSFTAHTAAPARFRPAGVDPAGTWVGGNRTLPAGVGGVGVPIVLQVRAWDSDGGTLTWDQADAQSRARGLSTFVYTQGLSTPPAPVDTFMVSFNGIIIGIIPEPSVIGLVTVGAGALFLLRRRKQS